MTKLSDNWLLAEQKRDEEIQKLVTALNKDQLDDYIVKTIKIVRSGVLYREVQRSGRTRTLPIVPTMRWTMRWFVINNIHESIIYLGLGKILEKLYNHYWFERVMSVLKSMLATIEFEKDKSWHDSLGDVHLALNCTINRDTKVSPLELLIGRVARPLDLMTADSNELVCIDEVREIASNSMKTSACYDTKCFDKSKASVSRFSVGEFVLIENEERNQTKLDAK